MMTSRKAGPSKLRNSSSTVGTSSFLSSRFAYWNPSASAVFTKFFFLSDLSLAESRPLKKSRCHCMTIPSPKLFSTMILIGRSYVVTVSNSPRFMRILASPSTSMTILSGRANCAPMAAGRPNPMVPMLPEVSQRRGSRKSEYCAAHIWCWPTPVVMIASPRVMRFIVSMT